MGTADSVQHETLELLPREAAPTPAAARASGRAADIVDEPAGPASRTVAVYPLVPSRSFDEPLTYALPDALAEQVQVGALVDVPVGAARRAGVVAALDVEAPAGVRLRPIQRLLPDPLMPPEMVGLAEWVADTYGCARTRALALVVTPRIAAHARAAQAPDRRAVQAVRRVAVARHEGDPAAAVAAVEQGSDRAAAVAAVEQGGDPAATATATATATADLAAATDALSSRSRAVLDAIPDRWTSVADLTGSLGTTRATLKKLADAGLLELAERETGDLAPVTPVDGAQQDVPTTAAGVAATVAPDLTAAQAAAVEQCAAAGQDGADPAVLLMGVTGSGKTEVYLELIRRDLAAGRGAIVLVPEIALTPQTAGRFLRRFPGQVEVLHSGLTKGERRAAWERIARGHARVVVGPRSAVFAPVHDLGSIVVDEEHDGSYKQESDPRYDARRVAWWRARAAGARVVFGSATPRVESWSGVASRVRLRERVAGGRLAPVQLVDLGEHGDQYPLTDIARAAIDQTLRRGRKAIVLHNRRGWANALHCRACAHTFRCPNCDVSLVVHGRAATGQQLACHHCGHTEAVPRACPECRAADITRLGAGTERLERDLVEQFGKRVHRLDADAVRGAGEDRDVAAVLEAFSAPGPALLVGTQMIAKGHDFPDVETAVVIDADAALAIPDFRAEERAFALTAQLAGRAGRAAATAATARVIVQTWDPQLWIYQHVAHHDVEGFLERELERRRELDYPPFARLVRVLVSAPESKADAAETWARAVTAGLRQMDAGPVGNPAPLMRIAARARTQVVLKTRTVAPVARAMRSFLRSSQSARRTDDVRIVLDVDPQSLA